MDSNLCTGQLDPGAACRFSTLLPASGLKQVVAVAQVHDCVCAHAALKPVRKTALCAVTHSGQQQHLTATLAAIDFYLLHRAGPFVAAQNRAGATLVTTGWQLGTHASLCTGCALG